MIKTKREKALEGDIQEARDILCGLAKKLSFKIRMSPKMGVNPKVEKEYLKSVEKALATLDYYPVGKNDYPYHD